MDKKCYHSYCSNPATKLRTVNGETFPYCDYCNEWYNNTSVVEECKCVPVDSVSVDDEVVADFSRIQDEIYAIFKKKQHDYGPGNISAFGEYGVLVRTTDKIERLKNLLSKGEAASNESIEDSWIDLSSYAIIALMCRRGLWPGVAGEERD